MRLVPVVRTVGLLALIAACSDSPVSSPRSMRSGPSFAASKADEASSEVLAAMNVALLAAGRSDVAIDRAEVFYDTAAFVDGALPATNLIANDRTHLVGSQLVPSDPRRGGSAAIEYLVDQSDGAALSFSPTGTIVVLPNTATEGAIDAAMQTWQNAPACGAPTVTKVADNGSDPDLVDGLVAGNPALVGTPRADITFAGWLPSGFFNALTPGGASFILGVTFTFTFIDAAGNPTDIDHDHHADVAFREIYFNRSFGWGTDLRPANVDVQSVAVHEAGHAYGLGHFGKVFVDNNGTLKYAPRAIMNAVYASPFRDLAGADNASFCQAWANAH